MKTDLTNPRSAIIAGSLLALPFVTLILLLLLGFEPSLGPLPSVLKISESHLGSLILFGAFLLLLVAFFVCSRPILRNIRAGKSIAADPILLLLAISILTIIIIIVGGIILDQYPCWIGVPNCD